MSEVAESTARALECLFAQTEARSIYASATLAPHGPASRLATGVWTGTFTPPLGVPASLPYTPILVTAPQYFPLIAAEPAQFMGRVDYPFYSMEGFAAAEWGSYYVVGSVDDETQFVTKVLPNATWQASVDSVAPGNWSFQLVAYPSVEDEEADTNRIEVGNAWLQTERPGDVRTYYSTGYAPRAVQFTDVVVARGEVTSTITGTLNAFDAVEGRTYNILVTDEVDVEYAWAVVEDAEPGAFTIERGLPINGKAKLRLVECVDGRAVTQTGGVWDEDNASLPGTYNDLRIEYRACVSNLPFQPSSVYPARLNGTWSVTLAPPGTPRVSLVDINNKRILGQYTMPSGLVRSYTVPAALAGQMPNLVYYDDFNDACFIYDQAVILIAYLQTGQRERARALLEAILETQNPDGSFPFAVQQYALQMRVQSYIRIGAVAWMIYALLLCDQPQYASWFPNKPTEAAKKGLDFMLSYRNPIGLINGGSGSAEGDPDYVVPWWSTEHNLDCWWCYDLAATLYRSTTYRLIAEGIKNAMLTPGQGWNEARGIFWQGGIATSGSDNTPDGMHALDTMTWGAPVLIAWGRKDLATTSVNRAYNVYFVTDEAAQLSGFCAYTPTDGYPAETVMSPWYEGSYGAVIADRSINVDRADATMDLLIKGQREGGIYPYVVRDDPVNGMHPYMAAIGPAWQVLAYAGPGTPYDQVFWLRASRARRPGDIWTTQYPSSDVPWAQEQ